MGEKSLYVEHINLMLREADKGSTLYTCENSIFLNKLLHHDYSRFRELMNERDITFKVFTWEDSPIEELHDLGAKVYLLDKEITEHYSLLDKPRMLRIERHHEPKGECAIDVSFTPDAYQDLHKRILSYFTERLEKEAKVLEHSTV